MVASLQEKRGVYVVVGTGGGGGPDTTFMDRETAKQRQAAKAEKAKKKEQSRLAKEKIREQKRAAREEAEELDTESEGSDASESEDESDEEVEHEKGYGFNRFGTAFQEVVSDTQARVRIDSFEHCVVEVKKEDLGGFLESLSMKAVVG